MDINNLIEICKSHKLELVTDTTPYGRSLNLFLNDKRVDNQQEKFSEILDWSYSVLNETIVNQLETLDGYSCKIFTREENLYFDFEFNNSWEYEGSFGEDRVTPIELLPYLPDFINEFKEFQNLELDEETLFCSFTYEKNSDMSLRLEIYDVWSEGKTEMSFLSCFDLIESLKRELVDRIELKFSGHDYLWICSEDGIDISLLSTYKREFSYQDLLEK